MNFDKLYDALDKLALRVAYWETLDSTELRSWTLNGLKEDLESLKAAIETLEMFRAASKVNGYSTWGTNGRYTIQSKSARLDFSVKGYKLGYSFWEFAEPRSDLDLNQYASLKANPFVELPVLMGPPGDPEEVEEKLSKADIILLSSALVVVGLLVGLLVILKTI